MLNSTGLPFRIKFCGFKTTTDIENAVEAGADAVGLNFFAKSPRFVDGEQSRILARLAHRISPEVCCVGVFVNPTLDYLRSCVERASLDMIQLHGDELPDLVANVPDLPPIIKAIPWRENCDEDAQVARLWTEARHDTRLTAFLVDAYDPVQRGGTGKVTRWDLLNPRPLPLSAVPMILAGGLTPQNIFDAIKQVQPDAVDTASGVEIAAGQKDRQKMFDFANQAKLAFQPSSLRGLGDHGS